MKNTRRERARRLDLQLSLDYEAIRARCDRRRALVEDPRNEAASRPGTDDAKHVAHCCANHGCAYDSDDCPVEALRLRQRPACGAAAPCSSERVRPVRLPPRRLDFTPPVAPGDRRLQHLTGGAKR